MNCQYCQTEGQSGNNCGSCGAPLKKQKDKAFPSDWKSEPFFYNGYIVYELRHYQRDTYEVQFWLGMELIERIEIAHQTLKERVHEGCDTMPFFWELFLVARGEQEAMVYYEKNKKYPAMFLITRTENEYIEKQKNATLEELLLESKKAGYS